MPVAAQPLARVLQTAYRAELKAILVALEYAIRHDAWCRIWTDCVNAIKAFKLFFVLMATVLSPITVMLISLSNSKTWCCTLVSQPLRS
jgi:hypothetical protein